MNNHIDNIEESAPRLGYDNASGVEVLKACIIGIAKVIVNCEKPAYSLDDASSLRRIAVALNIEALRIAQCCT